ncbi:hypothetical protein BHE74_00050273 [Ensete ventricosum]|nr:hypothetical protein BHE74_00050273 [Ensete ventricosum]
MRSVWVAALAAGTAALGQHLVVGRCHFVRALPLLALAPASGRSWRSPLQAAALAEGQPLVAMQRAAAPCGLATGAAYARRRCPFRR